MTGPDLDEPVETTRWAVRWLATLAFCAGALIGSIVMLVGLLALGALR